MPIAAKEIPQKRSIKLIDGTPLTAKLFSVLTPYAVPFKPEQATQLGTLTSPLAVQEGLYPGRRTILAHDGSLIPFRLGDTEKDGKSGKGGDSQGGKSNGKANEGTYQKGKVGESTRGGNNGTTKPTKKEK